MKVINELAQSSIQKNKKDSKATAISILMAVILIGTVIFILYSNKAEYHQYIIEKVRDQQVEISELDGDMVETLTNWDEVERLRFSKHIDSGHDGILCLKEKNSPELKSLDIIQGRLPDKSSEILVSQKFLQENNKYKLGDSLTIDDEDYEIVGTYSSRAASFLATDMYGILEDTSIEHLFKDSDTVSAQIWYKSIRDTYTNTRIFLEEFDVNPDETEEIGRLYYNTAVLEDKLVYPSGILPPGHIVKEKLEMYGPVVFLTLLFAVMIYGTFNVWNKRDIKEIGLLRSTGMTQKQVKKLVRKKAMKVSVKPILIGTILSYGLANLLYYLMWLNNVRSYKALSKIYQETITGYDFQWIKPALTPIILIIGFSFVTVFWAALVPAKNSAKLSITQAMNGQSGKKPAKLKKSKISRNIENSLAKDYLKAYRSSYRTMVIAMTLAAMVMTVVLVGQSFRGLDEKYNRFDSPYDVKSILFYEDKIDRNMLSEIEGMKETDEIHVYNSKDFKFFMDDNPEFFSDEVEKTISNGHKSGDNYFAKIYGLSDHDFAKVLEANNLSPDNNQYLLLNKTPSEDNAPYSLRKYISLTEQAKPTLGLRYNQESDLIKIQIDSEIDSFPYRLQSQEARGVLIFTSMENLEDLIDKVGVDEGAPTNYYRVKIKASGDINELTDNYIDIISKYLPESDHITGNVLAGKATDQEQVRNENMLNFGVQAILLIIALSTAYNSFHGNLMSRKKDFQLLITAGMTKKQISKMILLEGLYLVLRTVIIYFLVFVSYIIFRTWRKGFIYSISSLAMNINYLPILLVFVISCLGIYAAIKSGKKNILGDDIIEESRAR